MDSWEGRTVRAMATEQVTVDKAYLEALQAEHDAGEGLSHRIYVGVDAAYRKCLDTHAAAWKETERRRPKPPDPIDVLQRIVDHPFLDGIPRCGIPDSLQLAAEQFLRLVAEGIAALQAHDKGGA